MINEFQGEYRWLSNFHPFLIRIGEFTYPTVEHFYQASKATRASEAKAIAEALTPGNAKYLGQRCKMRDDWEDVKDLVMMHGVLAKFNQNIDLWELLDNTGDQLLQEGNTWNDKYWGICLRTGEGKNKLGKILMMVRDVLR